MILINDFLKEYSGQLAVLDIVESAKVEIFYKVNYGDFSFPMTTADLKAIWDYYLFECADNLKKAVNVLKVDYDPISNYDRTETNTKTLSNEQTNTSTDTNTIGEKAVTDTVSAFDSSTYSPNSQSTESEHTDTLTKNGSLTNNQTETFTSKVSGNIGVTTSQQMAESEIALRKVQVISDFLKKFANTYFIYIDRRVGE